METLSVLLALCEGTSPVTGEFPSQRPVTPSFDVFDQVQRSFSYYTLLHLQYPSLNIPFSAALETYQNRQWTVICNAYNLHVIVSYIIVSMINK